MDVSVEAKKKPLSTLSPFSYIPPRRNEPKEMSYFNRESKMSDVSTYDHVFHQVVGYDMMLDRDDRKHKKGKGLDISKEGRDMPSQHSADFWHCALGEVPSCSCAVLVNIRPSLCSCPLPSWPAVCSGGLH
ncbi:uncharacterized protein C5orf49 homolog isoform X2 [Mugil cephalus]|uniref:uncharacterized protein C5orf49 homolog isoform X2 n=1 Tax=Mugil cephalus TaxID=48193 RepID=UPI001FB6807D|nr:uncharacterized protein C5orf49 homolog isoform X2 [Mugil cephalus]